MTQALETFACRDRSDGFSSRNFLERHRTQKHVERRHQCTYCSYSSDKRTRVLRHERTHTREGFFPCGTCGKAFPRQDNLTKHQVLHTGERPYTCTERSSASFTENYVPIQHARIHSGYKRYPCHLCKYRTSDSGNLKKHIICVHTKEFPHTCELCGKGFVAPSQLRTHLADKHGYVEKR